MNLLKGMKQMNASGADERNAAPSRLAARQAKGKEKSKSIQSSTQREVLI